jgi:hypothetical protein
LKDTFKLIAAEGNILVQAQTGDVDIAADKKIKLTACKEKLTATAGQEFLLQSGGGYIRISGGNIETHCPGTFSMKVARFVHEAGRSTEVRAPDAPRVSDGLFVAAAGALGAAMPGSESGDEKIDLHSVPKNPGESPKTIDLSKLQPEFKKLWDQSFPSGKSQEYGGVVATQKSGDFELVNTGGGTSGSFSPNLDIAADSKLLGIFHTHPMMRLKADILGYH